MSVILIVEDEEQVRVLAESFLQTEGNKTLSAATIEQALVLIEGEEPVDLLFVDLKIQDDVEGGLKLAKKAVEARPKLKVLYTSGQGVTDGMIALFVEKSAFLPKPYTVEQLATTLLAKFSIGSRSTARRQASGSLPATPSGSRPSSRRTATPTKKTQRGLESD
jgi:DNA-binding NtrC family response regulator